MNYRIVSVRFGVKVLFYIERRRWFFFWRRVRLTSGGDWHAYDTLEHARLAIEIQAPDAITRIEEQGKVWQ